MTEEEKREFEEFLQWKEAKKKYEEEKKREQEEAERQKELAEQQREAERRAKERVKERAKAVNISDSTVKWPVEDIYPDRKMPKPLLFLLVCAFGLLVYMLSTVVHETNNASPSRATKGDPWYKTHFFLLEKLEPMEKTNGVSVSRRRRE